MIFLVNRVFNNIDSDDFIENDLNVRYYGWTDNKYVIKAFLLQRDRNKYDIQEISKERLEELDNGGPVDTTLFEEIYEIKPIFLYQKGSKKKIPLYMTEDEYTETLASIRHMFQNQCKLSNLGLDNLEVGIDMIARLKIKYVDVLSSLGYMPIELDQYYIPSTYSDEISYNIPNDLAPFLYNLNTFIKVMKEDM